MADVRGANFTKEWINDPSEQADAGTRFAKVLAFYDTFGTVANTDVLVLARIQHKVRFLSIEALGGDDLGAGLTRIRDAAGNLTTVVSGDLIDPAGVTGGYYDLVRIADASTDSDIAVLAKVIAVV